jgi:hypothetical protein
VDVDLIVSAYLLNVDRADSVSLDRASSEPLCLDDLQIVMDINDHESEYEYASDDSTDSPEPVEVFRHITRSPSRQTFPSSVL